MLKASVRICAAAALSVSTMAISTGSTTPEILASGAVTKLEVALASQTEAATELAAWSDTAQSRGKLLYATHCLACHTTQIHWRDGRSAIDWTSLELQVRRWQRAASLGRSDNDILDVTRYLNENIYRFEGAPSPVSSSGLPAVRSEPGAHRASDRRVP